MLVYCGSCRKVVDNWESHIRSPEHQSKLLLARGIPQEVKNEPHVGIIQTREDYKHIAKNLRDYWKHLGNED